MRYVAPTSTVREWFHQGENRRAYEMLGAHPVLQDGIEMWHFAVWAPNARLVSLVGEFCQWDRLAHPMVKQFDGTWEIRLPASTFDVASNPQKYNYPDAAEKLLMYKYAIQGEDHEKADPYGFRMQLRPNTASMLCDLSGYSWQDQAWMDKRAQWDPYHSPMNIYEMHLGSWRRHKDKTLLSYTEIADQLVPYLTDMGYTHVELLPVMEHPFDGSWGYQVTGYYAATSRYGEPKELMALIDRLHQAGIGVILDWVPAHFPRDEIGLRRFDGTCCYEHPDPRRGEMPQWGTCMFDFGRGEVRSFLLSNACFWLDEYHIDALRVDAVSSMLYLDYSRKPGQWHPNIYGGRENLEAIDFLKEATATAYKNNPGIMMIAEESTAYPGITAPTDAGGLGFGLKWNMGWMHDTLQYLHEEPINRKWHHNEITFSMVYAYSEHYVLPISHDEVVYGKGSLFGKMPGDDWQRYAGVRALFAYQWAHPGKKLSFMGNEVAQYGEWDHDGSVDWDALNWPDHRGVQKLVADLNTLYKASPALWSQDFDPAGFQWLTSDDADHNTLSFVRIGKDGEQMVVVVNFSGEAWEDYQVPLTKGGKWTEVLTTDDKKYGGSDIHNGTFKAVKGEYHSRDWSAKITVPALGAVFLKPEL